MTITFDRLRYVNRLTSAGIPEAHAHAHADALIEALSVVARTEIQTEVARIERLSRVATDLRVAKWILGITIVLVIAIFVKLFSTSVH